MVTLEELDKFIGRIITRSVLGQKGLPCFSLWNTSWGCPMFNKRLFSNRFIEIKRFLRFDMKSDRSRRLIEDSFALPPPCGTASLRIAKNHMSRMFI